MNETTGQKIVNAMIRGYGPRFSEHFPHLEDLFAAQPTVEEVEALKAPIPALGRYRKNILFMGKVTSAQAQGLARFFIIKKYFLNLAQLLAVYQGPYRKVIGQITAADIETINTIGTTLAEVHQVDIMEQFSEHDTAGAVDLFKLNLASLLPHLAESAEGVHFACTSEDVMGNVFGLIANELVYNYCLPAILDFCDFLISFLDVHGDHRPLILPELTHEQAAETTTLTQKMAVRLYSILYCIEQLQDQQTPNHGFRPFSGKLGGAIGDLKCHYAAYPDIDWHEFAREFVEDLGLYYHPFTDQCVSYILEAQHFKTITNILAQIIKLAKDFVGMARCPGQLFAKEKGKGQKGSSIMPNKSNLWQIEGAIVMLKKASCMINFTANELPDYPEAGNMGRSYLFRDIGNDFMPIFIALARIRREMSKCHPNHAKIDAFFHEYPGMSGSTMQTVMKRIGISDDAYRAIQDIAINADGSYANAEQFRQGLEQKMEELQLEQSAKQELRSLLEPAYTIYPPIHEFTEDALARMAAQIQTYRLLAEKIQGLPTLAT